MKKKMSSKLTHIQSFFNDQLFIFKFRFIMETDHRTYVRCHCGTALTEQAFEEIWNVLMPLLNHFEDVLTNLAPS
jgi:hypothetical protein